MLAELPRIRVTPALRRRLDEVGGRALSRQAVALLVLEAVLERDEAKMRVVEALLEAVDGR